VSGATKSEQAVLMAAYHWANNPTDREAKRKLWKAVRDDMADAHKREQRALYRTERKQART
jgi:hypothetical protein